MEFATAEQTAKRLHVTTRAVQKWAKEGKIPGASQHGRAWMIPVDFLGPSLIIPESNQMKSSLLVCETFVPGKCTDYITSIADQTERDMVQAEYFYYCGNIEEAAEIAERYLEHAELSIALTAVEYYVMCNIALNRLHLAYLGFDFLKQNLEKVLQLKNQPELMLSAFFIAQIAGSFFHYHVTDQFPSVKELLPQLNGGMQLYALYFLAQEAFLNKKYERVLGIVDTALLLYNRTYPMITIYMKLLASAAYMQLKKVEQAKERFLQAWNLARLDHIILPFSRLHGAMSGLLEACLKRDYPKEYKEIIDLTACFSKGRKILLSHTEDQRLHLSPTEFTIAMLANRGWVVKEIAAHIDLSERMVKHHLSIIYEKLGVTSREELRKYMLH